MDTSGEWPQAELHFFKLDMDLLVNIHSGIQCWLRHCHCDIETYTPVEVVAQQLLYKLSMAALNNPLIAGTPGSQGNEQELSLLNWKPGWRYLNQGIWSSVVNKIGNSPEVETRQNMHGDHIAMSTVVCRPVTSRQGL